MGKFMLLLLFSFGCNLLLMAQSASPFEPGNCSMDSVVRVDSMRGSVLYARAKAFVAKSFNDANAVIQLDDIENLQLIVRGNTAVKLSGFKMGCVRFSMSIQTKDGRYRYIVSDAVHEKCGGYAFSGGDICQETPSGSGINKALWKKLRADFVSTMTTLIADLQKTMATPAAKDNW